MQAVTTGTDRKITFWDVYDGSAVRIVDAAEEAAMCDVAVDAAGDVIVSGGAHKLVQVSFFPPYTPRRMFLTFSRTELGFECQGGYRCGATTRATAIALAWATPAPSRACASRPTAPSSCPSAARAASLCGGLRRRARRGCSRRPTRRRRTAGDLAGEACWLLWLRARVGAVSLLQPRELSTGRRPGGYSAWLRVRWRPSAHLAGTFDLADGAATMTNATWCVECMGVCDDGAAADTSFCALEP